MIDENSDKGKQELKELLNKRKKPIKTTTDDQYNKKYKALLKMYDYQISGYQ
jgi:hypothetical protein